MGRLRVKLLRRGKDFDLRSYLARAVKTSVSARRLFTPRYKCNVGASLLGRGGAALRSHRSEMGGSFFLSHAHSLKEVPLKKGEWQ